MISLPRVATEVRYSLIQFCRNSQSIFFATAFPLMFLVLAWFLFGSQPAAITLYYADSADSEASHAFLAALNDTGAFHLKNGSGMDLGSLLRGGQISAYVEVAPDRGENASAVSRIFYGPSLAEAPVVAAAFQQATSACAASAAGVPDRVSLDMHDVPVYRASFVDRAIPGILGIAVLGSVLDLTVGSITRYRITRVFRKLATTPLSRLEWNLSRAVTGIVVSLLSVAVTLGVSWLFFGEVPSINVIVLLFCLTGAVMFVGLGMVLTSLFRGEDAANAAFIVTLPLIFLSGSVFPVDRLPLALHWAALISPLTYLNAGLYGAMSEGYSIAVQANLAIVAGLALLFFCLGVISLKWKDD